MSDVSSANDVLSHEELHAIERQVLRLAARSAAAGRARSIALDFELSARAPQVGLVPSRAFPTTWSSWALDDQAKGVGLCLPVDATDHIGVAVLRSGAAQSFWFGPSSSAGKRVWLGVPTAHAEMSPICQLLDDLCRTRLGLSTAPAARSADWYWLGQWMAEILAAANESPDGVLDVITIASAHPAIADDAVGDLDLAELAGFLVERHREHVRVADWECIRLDAIASAGHRFHELGTRFDPGPFSRWVSASSPSLSEFAEPLVACCSSLGLRLLGAVLADTLLRDRLTG